MFNDVNILYTLKYVLALYVLVSYYIQQQAKFTRVP